MKAILIITIIILGIPFCHAQTQISGLVTDQKGETLIGANVFIKDTYDGATTDVEGKFSFNTEETGEQTLIVSFIGYNNNEQKILLSQIDITLNIQLKEAINELTGVTITAGAFEASDEKKAVIFKPIDIVTTASSVGDVAGALNTLPGTQTVGETGKLFVRGGAAYETKVFIDGMAVQDFYGAAANNVPTRGRFSPFMFSGTMFSTGGYSAEYGQALSSALILNTNDLPALSQTDISLMTVGGDISHTKRWKNTSLSVKAEYTNLSPYFKLIEQTPKWNSAPESVVGNVLFRQKIKDTGMFKFFGSINKSDFNLPQPNPDDIKQNQTIDLVNDNLYLNMSYKDFISDHWSFRVGAAYTNDQEDINIDEDQVQEGEKEFHSKVTFTNDISDYVAIKLGSEIFRRSYSQDFIESETNELFYSGFNEVLSSIYTEADIKFSNKLALRVGGRIENSHLLAKQNIAPRISIAYKTAENSQVSFAYGKFYQTPENELMRFNQRIEFEDATHFIANYQYSKDNRTFRIEAYHKEYSDLLKFDASNPFDGSSYTNSGEGFARGIDIFWRDRKSIKNGDYWISYSYNDTERNYRDFPVRSAPTFASKHNLSIVYKQFITKYRTQLGLSYILASGRPYHNPNEDGFNQELTKPFQNLSLSLSYLMKPYIIIHASASNVFGADNVFGYQYSNTANQQGIFDRQAIKQRAKRFLFLGVFITLSKDKTKNQLNNI